MIALVNESRGSTVATAGPRALRGAGVALLIVHTAYCLSSSPVPTARYATPAQVQLRIDPNRATAAELELLPRIGPKIAAAIVAYRETAADEPAFRTAEDLDRVKRIGPATVALLRPFLCFPDNTELPLPDADAP